MKVIYRKENGQSKEAYSVEAELSDVNSVDSMLKEIDNRGTVVDVVLNNAGLQIGYKLNGTDVIISLTDPGWCQTDLGGPNAPNTQESALPVIN